MAMKILSIFKLVLFVQYLECMKIPRLFQPSNRDKPKFAYIPLPKRTALGRAAECEYEGENHDEGQEWDFFPNGETGDKFFGLKLTCAGGQALVKGCYESKVYVELGKKILSKHNEGYNAVCTTDGLEYEPLEKVCGEHYVGEKFKDGFYQYECTDNGPIVISCLNLNDEVVESGQEFTALDAYVMKCLDTPKGKVLEGQYCLDAGKKIEIGKSVRGDDEFTKTCVEERSDTGFQKAISLDVTECCEPGSDHCIKIGTEESSVVEPTYVFHCNELPNEEYESYYTKDDVIVTLPPTTVTETTTIQTTQLETTVETTLQTTDLETTTESTIKTTELETTAETTIQTTELETTAETTIQTTDLETTAETTIQTTELETTAETTIQTTDLETTAETTIQTTELETTAETTIQTTELEPTTETDYLTTTELEPTTLLDSSETSAPSIIFTTPSTSIQRTESSTTVTTETTTIEPTTTTPPSTTSTTLIETTTVQLVPEATPSTSLQNTFQEDDEAGGSNAERVAKTTVEQSFSTVVDNIVTTPFIEEDEAGGFNAVRTLLTTTLLRTTLSTKTLPTTTLPIATLPTTTLSTTILPTTTLPATTLPTILPTTLLPKTTLPTTTLQTTTLPTTTLPATILPTTTLQTTTLPTTTLQTTTLPTTTLPATTLPTILPTTILPKTTLPTTTLQTTTLPTTTLPATTLPTTTLQTTTLPTTTLPATTLPTTTLQTTTLPTTTLQTTTLPTTTLPATTLPTILPTTILPKTTLKTTTLPTTTLQTTTLPTTLRTTTLLTTLPTATLPTTSLPTTILQTTALPTTTLPTTTLLTTLPTTTLTTTQTDCKNIVYVYIYPNYTTVTPSPPEIRTVIVTKLVEVTKQPPSPEIIYITKYIYLTVKIPEIATTVSSTTTIESPATTTTATQTITKFSPDTQTKIIYIYFTDKPSVTQEVSSVSVSYNETLLTTKPVTQTEPTTLKQKELTQLIYIYVTENATTQAPPINETSVASVAISNISQIITIIRKYITEEVTSKPDAEITKLPPIPGYETKIIETIRTSQPVPYDRIVELINNYTKIQNATVAKTAEYITIVVTVTSTNETVRNSTTAIEKYVTVIVSVTSVGENKSTETVTKSITENISSPGGAATKSFEKQETIVKYITEYVTVKPPPGGADKQETKIRYTTEYVTANLSPGGAVATTKIVETKSSLMTDAGEKCQKGWIFFNKKCFYVSPPGNRGTRFQAEAECARSGGRLAVIESKEEWEFLKIFLTTIQGTYPGRAFDGFWIGLYLNNQTNKWQWVNGGGLQDIPWLPNPGNVRGRVGNVALNVRGCGEARWDTVDWGMDKDHCMHKQWFLCDGPFNEIVSITTTPIPPPSSNLLSRMRCMNTWLPFENHCYFFSKRESRIDFKEAETVCSNEGGYLLVINNDKEQEFIISELENRRNRMPDESLDGYWVGIIKNVKDDFWTWIKSSDFTKSYWLPEDSLKMWELIEESKSDPDRRVICGEMKFAFERWGLDKDHCLHQEAYICEKDLMEPIGDCTSWKFACPKNSDCTKLSDDKNVCICKTGLLGDGYNCMDEKNFF